MAQRAGIRVEIKPAGEKIYPHARAFHFDGYTNLVLTDEQGNNVALVPQGTYGEVEVVFE
jgi:hypothetical protein